MRNCVIHPRFVVAEFRNRNNSRSEKNLALQAHFDIETIIRSDPNVVILDTGDPASVADFFKPGEEVMLYGAYRDGCLQTAREALLAKGVKVDYHPTGSISMFPVE
ncbi:MAG TPA: hypothetical protein VJI98_06665 [Candidatus Nanoarchaeia archaeon]|nr:hypothetical protein [Candidatus Nanoarchaeia archaeon]